MMDFFSVMGKPLLACLILTGIHAYLGMHVIERKVIFVDLALAQIAAFGATLAFLFHFDLHSHETYGFSLVATFLGAAIFALTRTRDDKIPHEAIIGTVYAVTAAATILILSRTPEGDEHIRHILVGNVLLVTDGELIKMILLYGLMGLFHWKFREKFWMISKIHHITYEQRRYVRFWDLLFYGTFGFVVTSSVQVAGVLLVFSFLIVPSIIGMLFGKSFQSRLFWGWGVGIFASIFGMASSFSFDLPTGASVVCIFGLMLLMAGIFTKVKEKRAIAANP